jgi:hypothetical protein
MDFTQPARVEATREGRRCLFRLVRFSCFVMSFLYVHRSSFLSPVFGSRKTEREDALPTIRNSLFNVVIQLPVADLMLVLDALSYPLSCAIMARSSLAYGNCITVTFGIDGKASTPDSGYYHYHN